MRVISLSDDAHPGGQEQIVKIAVVAATFNAAGDLLNLIKSLRTQTDTDFEWVVADGCSTDETLGIIRQVTDLDIRLLEAEDFGIYDALNRAIKASSADYYIVAGADDVFDKDAVAQFRAAANGEFDFISAKVRYKGSYLIHTSRPSWLGGAWAYVSCHAVGCMIRKDFHERFGYYSKLFPLAADQLFIKRACQQGARVREADFVAGEFGSDGVSSVNTLVHLTDTFKVQYMTERSKWLQVLLFFLRVVKNKVQSRILMLLVNITVIDSDWHAFRRSITRSMENFLRYFGDDVFFHIVLQTKKRTRIDVHGLGVPAAQVGTCYSEELSVSAARNRGIDYARRQGFESIVFHDASLLFLPAACAFFRDHYRSGALRCGYAFAAPESQGDLVIEDSYRCRATTMDRRRIAYVWTYCFPLQTIPALFDERFGPGESTLYNCGEDRLFLRSYLAANRAGTLHEMSGVGVLHPPRPYGFSKHLA